MFYDPHNPPGLPLSGVTRAKRRLARKEAEHVEAQRRARQARLRKLVSLFDRDEIEDGVDALIAYLDARGGDADLEPAGDEEDHGFAEDDMVAHRPDGPGCPIADAGEKTLPEEHTNGRTAFHDDEHEEGPHDRYTRRHHRDRIRRTGCDVVVKGGRWGGSIWREYTLRSAFCPIAMGVASDLLPAGEVA